MNIPENLQYTKTHEWVEKLQDGTVRIGLTDYAQSELGDIVFVNLPQVGDTYELGASFADVESVKAVSDIYSPASGTITAANEALLDEPALINEDCYGAWLVEMDDVTEMESMLTASEYQKLISEES